MKALNLTFVSCRIILNSSLVHTRSLSSFQSFRIPRNSRVFSTSNHTIPIQMTQSNTPSQSIVNPQEILSFWFPDKEQKVPDLPKWFTSSSNYDEYIRSTFGFTIECALNGTLTENESWKDPENPEITLAHIIILDQLTRQYGRGSSKAFSGDEKARTLVKHSIEMEFDVQHFGTFGKQFGVLVPLMHSEILEDHELMMKKYHQYIQLNEQFPGFEEFAQNHTNYIRKYGRYPYRNKVLGRVNTREETELLENLPESERFGQ